VKKTFLLAAILLLVSGISKAETLQCSPGETYTDGPDSFLLVLQNANSSVTAKAVILESSTDSKSNWTIVSNSATVTRAGSDGPLVVDGSNSAPDWNSDEMKNECFDQISSYHFVIIERTDRIFGNFTFSSGLASNPNKIGHCPEPFYAPLGAGSKPKPISCQQF
jgi:hypothetical protein